MSGPRYRLTAEVRQQVVAFVRAGGFVAVAAEAAGVPRAVFARWLKRGRGPGAPACYRDLRAAVRQARAQARLGAEAAALSDKPLDWLRNGPGRESAGDPGWTGPVRPGAAKAGEAPLLNEQVRALIRDLFAALERFPDARAALAGVLAARAGGRGP